MTIMVVVLVILINEAIPVRTVVSWVITLSLQPARRNST